MRSAARAGRAVEAGRRLGIPVRLRAWDEAPGALTGYDVVVSTLPPHGADELAGHLAGADAVVFAAGAGPGSGAARKDTVDRGAAVLLADAAAVAGVRRYLLVSSMGAGAEPPAVEASAPPTPPAAAGAAVLQPIRWSEPFEEASHGR